MNEQQKAAATAPYGFVQIVAGPGTGKTKTLVARICHLLVSGIRPENMIVMTFTNAAAKEVRSRVEKELSNDSMTPVNTSGLLVGTFHSIAYRFLIKRSQFKIATDADQTQIMTEILKVSDEEQAGNNSPRSMLSRISHYKCRQKVPKSDKDRALYTAFHAYNNRLEQLKLLDFDDLLLRFKDLLVSDLSAANHVEAVLIDEFQDTNFVQLEIALALASKSGNMTVVGDPDQSIYSFRHANPGNFTTLQDKGAKALMLETNYRSTKGILKTAGKIIGESENRFAQTRTLQSTKPVDTAAQILKFRDYDDEARCIVNQVRHLLEAGVRKDEIAILARTANYTRAIQRDLALFKVPIRVLGGRAIAERKIFRTIIDYLRVVVSDEDTLAIKRSVNVPNRGIGPVTLSKLFTTDQESLADLRALTTSVKNKGFNEYLSIIDECRNLAKDDTPEAIGKVIKYIASKVLDREPAENDRTPEAQQLQSDWELVNFFVKEGGNVPEEFIIDESQSRLSAFVSSWSLSTEPREGGSDVVTVSTIHSSKGLEWPIVFVVGCNDPAAQSFRSEADMDWQEERRILYVAVTRAQCYLGITYTLQKSRLIPDGAAAKGHMFDANLKIVGQLLGREMQAKAQASTGNSGSGFPGFMSAADLMKTSYTKKPSEFSYSAQFKTDQYKKPSSNGITKSNHQGKKKSQKPFKSWFT